MSRPGTPFLSNEFLSDAGARLSRSLPPCEGGLGRGVAPRSVFVAYPSPERFAHSQGFALALFKTAAGSRLLLPRKGGGAKRGC
jgi:hypothetical protein